MSKNPVSKSKPVKRNEPMHNALKFFLAGCVAEIYLLVIRRFYVNGTANELLACDAALPYLMAAGAAVAVIGLVLGIVWRQQTKRRWIGWSVFAAGVFLGGSAWMIRTFYDSALTFLCVVVPVVMLLGILWNLYDRECSIQRRHQKVIEESPSPFLTDELRQRMGATAVAAAKAVGYVGAGTIEFLVDRQGNYYFLEMNTRLQVEHPVTEEVIGLDLVKEQIFIAAGQPLQYKQTDIVQRGHAIECRVCAEDPENNFMPAPGVVCQLTEPNGLGIRIDGYIYEGYEIPIWYDPMISKLIVHAVKREYAIERMCRALDEYKITGVTTNIAYLNAILHMPDFVNGDYNTAFLKQNGEAIADYCCTNHPSDEQAEEMEDLALIAAHIDYLNLLEKSGGSSTSSTSADPSNRWREFGKRKGVLGI